MMTAPTAKGVGFFSCPLIKDVSQSGETVSLSFL